MEETSSDLSNPNPTKGCLAPRCLLLGRLNSVCVCGGGWGVGVGWGGGLTIFEMRWSQCISDFQNTQ